MMNKCLNVIGILLVLLLFPYCERREAQQIEGQGGSIHAALAEIDSLMWQRADSAFVLLQEFVVSLEAEELDTFDGHYCQVLISELLYKNDCEQTNREDLLKAVGYFDSLIVNKHDANKREVVVQKQNVFLDARAHYINGVGYYERGDLVQACAEYLKTLEVMEEHFGEKELVGHKARFMAYTYNRLGDMFSEQFMMESAIKCYEGALYYCNIELTSPYGISNILTRLGVQYDKLGNKEKMRDYYGQALESMPNSDNLSYRDLAASKALCDYQLGLGIEQSLNVLKQVLADADDESERLTRFLTIGAIYAEEELYDSATFYLEPVLENEKDEVSQIQAAECLRIIYDSIGDNENLDKCLRFLALQKKSEGQNKVLVSQLEDLFKSHVNRKQEKEAEEERKNSIKKTIRVIVPIAVAVVLTILIIAKRRSKRLLEKQQEEAVRKLGESEQQHEEELRQRQAEADRTLEERDKQHAEVLESERQTHRMEQAAMSGRLKRSNQEVRELKDQIQQQNDRIIKTEPAASFTEEPVCRLIMQRVNEGQFKSQMDCAVYKDYALGKEQVTALREAADRHYNQFTSRLTKAYPDLTRGDLDYCCLYLLGLSDADIAALMQKAYPTVSQRARKMKAIFGSDEPLSVTLHAIAHFK